MRGITRDDLLEVLNRVSVSLLLSRDAPKLITGVNLFSVNLQRAFKTRARFIELAAALMNQTEVVMRRRIGRIQCRRFKVLLESGFRALTAHDVAEVTPQQ